MTARVTPRLVMDAGNQPRAIAAAEVERWLDKAQAGDEIVYATGASLPQGVAVVHMMGELARAGVVRTHVRRSAETRALEYFAVRRPPRFRYDAGAAGPEEADAFANPDDARVRMLSLLIRAASSGRPCPTNAELAEALGLKNAEAARYIFNQLVRAGKIRSVDHGPRLRRVVTILDTGNSTKGGVGI